MVQMIVPKKLYLAFLHTRKKLNNLEKKHLKKVDLLEELK